MSVRLKINGAAIIDGEIRINSLSIIDGESGEMLRVSSITPELLDLFLHIEIELSDYMKVQEAIKANPAFSKLVNTFNLTL